MTVQDPAPRGAEGSDPAVRHGAALERSAGEDAVLSGEPRRPGVSGELPLPTR
ncbi:hypothetical protein [Kitasatospora sp. NPDC002965]|uniref:hypothetical protein n=1 Tax=Kitasatospora sp. NPDC002965 TaxID=3154775 RepID=UPI0033A17158